MGHGGVTITLTLCFALVLAALIGGILDPTDGD